MGKILSLSSSVSMARRDIVEMIRNAGHEFAVGPDFVGTPPGNSVVDQLLELIPGHNALIVGGVTKRIPFGNHEAEELASKIKGQYDASGGSVIVTTSRRTGKTTDTLFEKLKLLNCKPIYFHRWMNSDENPYFGILAYSDDLVVTGDSISMLSDACAAPGTVYIYNPEKCSSTKHLRFHEELYALGAARPLRGHMKDWRSVQFNSAEDIAVQIKSRLGW